MPAVLEGAVPPPHLHHLTSLSSWSSQDLSLFKFPNTPSPTLPPMSPASLSSYLPHHEDETVPGHDLTGVSNSPFAMQNSTSGPQTFINQPPSPQGTPNHGMTNGHGDFTVGSGIPMQSQVSSSWYTPTIPAQDPSQNMNNPHFNYHPSYMAPHPTPLPYSSSPHFPKTSEPSVTSTSNLPQAATFSPTPSHSKLARSGKAQFDRVPGRLYPPHLRTVTDHSPHLRLETNPPTRPRSSPSTFTPVQTSNAPHLDISWTLNPADNPLGISTPPMHDPYFDPNYMGASDIAAPQPRRMYAPIAPHPHGPQRSVPPKRSRDDDELSEQSKRRKRSDSNTTSMELGEEDRLLIQLKDEESMPWKDIAARFQSDLGKTYQIPALQMRLKRLRERMRVWTETDIRALRMAHDYWVQNKFEIISQKMLDFGCTEKWTTKQCSRKWQEIDPGPTPYSSYDLNPATSYAPYTMSPIEAPAYIPSLPLY